MWNTYNYFVFLGILIYYFCKLVIMYWLNYSSAAINLTSVVPSVEILWNEQILNLSRLSKIIFVFIYYGNIFELIKNKLILNVLTL